MSEVPHEMEILQAPRPIWKEEEEHQLTRKVKELGNRWHIIAPYFPWRTAAELKKRMTLIKGKSIVRYRPDLPLIIENDYQFVIDEFLKSI